MTGPPLLDRAVIDDLCDSIGADGARSVVELFVAESRNYLATISAAAAPGSDAADRERARRAAHSLKSGAGQIGAAAVAAAAAEVERVAGSGADLTQVIAALAQCAEDTAAVLAQFSSEK